MRLPGQYFDSETNLHYNYFRYYDPTLGRYITSDPIGLYGGSNTYGYGYQINLVETDPSGLLILSSIVDRWPRGLICGPANDPELALKIPDFTPEACQSHDNCYEACAVKCKGTSCKLLCDLQLWSQNNLYGLTTALFGSDTYEDLKKRSGCEDRAECKEND